MQQQVNNKMVKSTFWGASIFYFLIAFEFLYMAGPFAIYFYSAYKPALNFFNDSILLSWLTSFFLPHAAQETSSALLNSHNIVGAVLTLVGFTGFLWGAVHIYYYKLRKKGIVTGGIYNRVRHPQYSSFILCSLGLLILWPRFIVLIMFITMLFIYYLLARAEERECEAKYGTGYIAFKAKTGMFLPFRLHFLERLIPQTTHRTSRILLPIAVYLISLTTAIGVASLIQQHTINSLYTVYDKDSITISLSKIDMERLEQVVQIALSDQQVSARIDQADSAKLLNYVLPTTWFAAEVPMNGVRYRAGHKSPRDYDPNLYKIIFTEAVMRTSDPCEGEEILTNTSKREGIAEVWVDLSEQKVTQLLELPESTRYENVPVALY